MLSEYIAHHFLDLVLIFLVMGLYSKQRKLFRYLSFIIKTDKQMGAELDALTSQVTANTDAEAAAVTLLGALKTDLDAAIAAGAAGDATQLQALSAKLGSSKDALAAAIVANTPAASTGA